MHLVEDGHKINLLAVLSLLVADGGGRNLETPGFGKVPEEIILLFTS